MVFPAHPPWYYHPNVILLFIYLIMTILFTTCTPIPASTLCTVPWEMNSLHLVSGNQHNPWDGLTKHVLEYTSYSWNIQVFFMFPTGTIKYTLVYKDSPGICTRLSLTLTLISGKVYQVLSNQNTESGDICHLLFHGICHWLTSSDPSFILILK